MGSDGGHIQGGSHHCSFRHDFKGPAQSPLRLHVHMYDDLDKRATTAVGKEVGE